MTLASISAQDRVAPEIFLVCPEGADGPLRDLVKGLPDRLRIVSTGGASMPSAVSRLVETDSAAPFAMLLAPGDRLLPDALANLCNTAAEVPDAVAIFGDDIIACPGRAGREVRRKPAWCAEFFCGTDYIGHAVLLRRDAVRAVNGFDPAAARAEMTDLLLRLAERYGDTAIARCTEVVVDCALPKPRPVFPLEAPEHPPIARQAVVARFLSRREGRTVRAVSAGFAGGLRAVRPIVGEPLVSILIPTRDRLDLLRRTVDGVIRETTYRNVEVLILDNGSVGEDTREWFQDIVRIDKRVRVLPMPGAFNYSRLNNEAARVARGEYLLFLNNDVEVISPSWLEEMLSLAQSPGTGCVGAKLTYPDGRLQHAGVAEAREGGFVHVHHRAPGDTAGPMNRFRLRHEAQAVTGACMMMKADLFQRLGGFDAAGLKVVYNDIDLCFRARDLGLSVIWTPFAHLVHHESASRGDDHDQRDVPRAWAEAMRIADRWEGRVPSDPWDHPLRETQFRPEPRLPPRHF